MKILNFTVERRSFFGRYSPVFCISYPRGKTHSLCSMYSLRKSHFDSSSRSAGKPQKMHRLCGTRKRKESSAVGWYGSINYLTKPPPAHRSPPLLPACPSPSTSRCSAGVLAPKHWPLVPAMFPSRAQPSSPPLSFSLSLSVFSLLRVDTLVDPDGRPRSEISS